MATALTSPAALTSDQVREEHAYVVGVQAALWGRPFAEYLHTVYEGMKAGAAYLNYLHKFSALKTAADRYVNTPNNVSIDAYGNADLAQGARRHQRCRAAGETLVHRPDRRHVRRDRLQHRRVQGRRSLGSSVSPDPTITVRFPRT